MGICGGGYPFQHRGDRSHPDLLARLVNRCKWHRQKTCVFDIVNPDNSERLAEFDSLAGSDPASKWPAVRSFAQTIASGCKLFHDHSDFADLITIEAPNQIQAKRRRPP